MDIRTREAIRYLGYGNHAVDDHTLDLIENVFKELDQLGPMKIVYRIFDISQDANGHLQIGQLDIESKSLKRNLKGCKEAILLAASLGPGVDRLLRKYSIADMARVVVIQACAAASLEDQLDSWQENMARKFKTEDLYLRPRFSPGYGDFSIEHQPMFVQMLEASKRVGVTVTDSLMLSPSKSVTALIGISREAKMCRVKGCEACGKTDCEFRRC